MIGYTILDNNGKFVDIGHLDLKNLESFFIKIDYFKKFIKTDPAFRVEARNYFYVEEPLKAFKQNSSMAQTLALLQRFNAVCCYIIYDFFDVEPVMIHSNTARSRVGLKIPRTEATKPYILDFVKKMNIIPETKWAYKKTGTPKDWCFDQADSFVIARAGYIMNEYK